MQSRIEPSWYKVLEPEFSKEYFTKLTEFVSSEYQQATVYPPRDSIFRAFALTPFEAVRVVIIGQDPYHGENQANGLCFSVNQGVKIPPSLRNIYKEIESDTGEPSRYPTGDLEGWAKQGVLLLNATLTVQAHSAGSHQKKGWEHFTDATIRALSDQRENLVFFLWGNYAKEKGAIIDDTKHLVINSPHPSPFSAYSGFFGSKPFSRCNNYLINNSFPPITW